MTFEEELREHGFFIYKTKGDSMRPLIRPGRDIIEIGARGKEPLRKYDVVLYRDVEKYILHRIIRIRKGQGGTEYSAMGDHNFSMDRGVRDEEVIGVLTGIIRDGTKRVDLGSLKYRLYVLFWCRLYPLRIAAQYLINTASSLFRKIAGKAARNG